MPIDFALLELFMRYPDQTFSQDSLLARVWRDEVLATSDSLRQSIKRIRQKLDTPEQESIIETIPRTGYRPGKQIIRLLTTSGADDIVRGA